MRIGLSIIAYNEHAMIKACLKQIPDWIERTVVLLSERPWHGRNAPDPGKTEIILHKLGVETVKLAWRTESEQRNYGLALMYDFDWVIILDADEFYSKADWDFLKDTLNNPAKQTFVYTASKIVTYWKTPQYKLDPPDDHQPIIAVMPKKTVFFDKRETVEMTRGIIDITMHHFSWVKSNEDVWFKIHNWSHSKDFIPSVWYNNLWLNWNKDTKNVHPYGNKECKAIDADPPQEIMGYFKN